PFDLAVRYRPDLHEAGRQLGFGCLVVRKTEHGKSLLTPDLRPVRSRNRVELVHRGVGAVFPEFLLEKEDGLGPVEILPDATRSVGLHVPEEIYRLRSLGS